MGLRPLAEWVLLFVWLFLGALSSSSAGLVTKKAHKGSSGWSSVLDREPQELSKSCQAPDHISQNPLGVGLGLDKLFNLSRRS